MNETTFRQLKESKYYFPEVTEVIYDNDIMLDIVINGTKLAEIGFNTAWDSQLCKWGSKYFLDGLNLVEQRIKGKRH